MTSSNEDGSASRMNAERAFATKLFEASSRGDFTTIRSLVDEYRRRGRDGDGDDDGRDDGRDDDERDRLSVHDVVSQFRDGQKRTLLHFAALSPFGILPWKKKKTKKKKTKTTTTSTKKKKDVMEELLPWLRHEFDHHNDENNNKNNNNNKEKKDDVEDDAAQSKLDALLRLKDKDGLTVLMLACSNDSYSSSNDDQHDDQHDRDAVLAEDDDKDDDHDDDEEDVEEEEDDDDDEDDQKYRRIECILATASPKAKLALMRSKAGATPLHYACGRWWRWCGGGSDHQNRHHLIRLLLSHGSVALMAPTLGGATPLHWAAAASPSPSPSAHYSSSHPSSSLQQINHSSLETTRTLVEAASASASAATTAAATAAAEAAEKGRSKQSSQGVVDVPESVREYINRRNERKMTALMLSAASGKDAVTKYLLQHGADYRHLLPGTKSTTLLHILSDLNLVGSLRILLQRMRQEQQQQEEEDESTTTTIAAATTTSSSSSHQEEWLSQKNDDGETALDLAVKEGHVGCVMLLLDESDEHVAHQYILNHNNAKQKEKDKNDKDTNDKHQNDNNEKDTKENDTNEREKRWSSRNRSVENNEGEGNNRNSDSDIDRDIDSDNNHNKNNHKNAPSFDHRDTIEQIEEKAKEWGNQLLQLISSSSSESTATASKMTASDKATASALEYKKEGNAFFASRQYERAFALYTKAIDCRPDPSSSSSSSSSSSHAAFYSNRSACSMMIAKSKPKLKSKTTTTATTTTTKSQSETTKAQLTPPSNQQTQQQQRQRQETEHDDRADDQDNMDNNDDDAVVDDTDDAWHKRALFDAVVSWTLDPHWAKASYRVAVARLALGRHEDAAMAAFESLKRDEDNDELKSLLRKCVERGKVAHQQQQQKQKQQQQEEKQK